MKVNPIGIQSYQQTNRQDKSGVAQAEQKATQAAEQKVLVEPQTTLQRPALAVKGPSGNYAEYLSTEEREALDMVFARLRDTARFGPGYRAGDESAAQEQILGQVVDVKV
ncbi:MAG: hypothetical protein DRP45_07025 [Candidatus Zixiibacteriota bacterium]|nr:MAG: hypothetical protein DRP45_07025 [candidate division Zixibacteria bacterium]